MFEFLLEPFVDTYYFGCPSSCIVPNGDTHQFLKLLLTPITAIVLGLGAIIGLLTVTGRLPNLESLRSIRIRKKSVTQAILDSPEATQVQEPKTIKQYERAIKKENKKDFLSGLEEMESNPEIAFSKFLELQDHNNHPMTESLQVARTEAKEEEIITPEVKLTQIEKEQQFYKENKASLEEQAKQVAELMKLENLTEEEAIDRIINEMPTEVEAEVKPPEQPEPPKIKPLETLTDENVDMEIDVFKQDIVEKEIPKYRKFLHTQFKKKKKPKYKYALTELGSERRDQYANQIEVKFSEWALPLPKYEGKNQEYQLEAGIVKSEIKKLCLFMSMCELMADKNTKKKVYWEKVRVAE